MPTKREIDMNLNHKSLAAVAAASMLAGCGMTVVEYAQVDDSAQPSIQVDHAEIVYIWMEEEF